MNRLFIPYYKEKNLQRRTELDYALKMNLRCNILDQIFIICENGVDTSDLSLIKSDKIIIIEKENRQTFKSMFELANSSTSENDINIFCNSDIFITDDFIKIITHLNKTNFLALTRWDLHTDGQIKLFNVNYSQDLWAYKGRLNNIDKMDINVYLGIIGCDNLIAAEIHKVGYQLINPAKDIVSVHVHWSGIRNYNADIRCAGDYLWPSSHKIGEVPIFERRMCPDDWKKGSGPDYV